jgi:hypothetical protein
MFYNPYFRSFGTPYYPAFVSPYFYGGGIGNYGYGGGINAIGSQFSNQSLFNSGTYSGNQIQSPVNIW